MNTITATFKPGSKRVTAPALYQWDYGQTLILDGLELPDSYEVHFSNKPVGGQAEVRIGTEAGVAIPDLCLETGEPVFAYVFLHSDDDDGETVYIVQIPVTKRPEPFYGKPTSAQQSVITEAIAALTAAIQKTSDFADAAELSAEAAAVSAEAAALSEADAFASAENAADSATIAEGHKNNAELFAEEAEGHSSDAAGFADNASGYASAASDSADEAAQSALDSAASAYEAEYILNNINSIVEASLQEAKDSGAFKGDRGETGPVFTPSISQNGTLSWTNNGGLPNPTPVDMVTVICNALPSVEGATF